MGYQGHMFYRMLVVYIVKQRRQNKEKNKNARLNFFGNLNT